jgi:quercetin dioxygenase-like cupin family protein
MTATRDGAEPAPEAQLRSYIDRLDPKNQKLVRAVRASVRKRFPTANELAYDYTRFFVIGYSPTQGQPHHRVVGREEAAGPEARQVTTGVSPSLDALIAAPDHHLILLENEHVRVLDTRVRPGETTPIHVHPWPSVLYVLSWSDFVRYDADGNVLLDSRKQASAPAVGSAIWAGPLPPHRASNVGTSDLHILAIEFKRMARDGKTMRRLMIALVLNALTCGCDNAGWAPVSTAWVTTLQLGLCLQEYERGAHRFPDSLGGLATTVSSARNGCAVPTADFLARTPIAHAGYAWTYGSSADGKAFALEASPVSAEARQCRMRVDQGMVVTRTCEGWLRPSVDTYDLN